MHSCLACLTALLPLYAADGDLAADVAGLCMDVAMRLGGPVAARRAADDASAPLRASRTEALFLAAALAGRLDAAATTSLARKLSAAAGESADAAPALSELLARLHAAGREQPCKRDVLCAAFLQRHWAAVHGAADAFMRLTRHAVPPGASHARDLLPAMAAVGDQAALKKLLTTTAHRVGPAMRASAPLRLEEAAEAQALEKDADALYAACCAAA